MNNMAYHNYLVDNENYFVKNNVARGKTFEIESVPSNYNILSESDSYWIFYNNKDEHIPLQGWKIHISTNIFSPKETINIVSDILFKRGASFKHLKDERALYDMNSKNAPRESSGKFITVYPKDENEFLKLLNLLDEKLLHLDIGPYILSDKRWKNTNIYYRYGAFHKIRNQNGDLCMQTPEGQLIKDERVPFYQVPDFKKDFDEYLNSINVQNSASKDNPLLKYDIKEALSFSNSGGVYLAIRKKDNKKVIIKEARPNTGYDGQYRSAFKRQSIEYNALKALSNVTGVVNNIEFFSLWEHRFLVEEFIEGASLQDWLTREYPFHSFVNIASFKGKLHKIFKQLNAIVKEIHTYGISIGDLQPSNIIITEDLTVKLIDFETADDLDKNGKIGMATAAFSNNDIKNNKDRDLYALDKTILFCLAPTYSTKETEKLLLDGQLSWIYKNFGESFFEYLSNLDVKNIFKSRNIERIDSDEFIFKIKQGVWNNINQNNRSLINGDIRQYEEKYGHINILTGGMGAIWSLIVSEDKTIINDKRVNYWINNRLESSLNEMSDQGLFTGLAGIAVILYNLGYKKRAQDMLLNINIREIDDDSLISGKSGVGIALLSLYVETQDTRVLKKSIHIANNILQKKTYHIDNNQEKMGVLHGNTGIALFLTLMYKYTKEKKYFNHAIDYIEKDLENCFEAHNTLQIKDNRNRYLPYLSEGSIGIAIVLFYIKNISCGFNKFDKKLYKILKLINTKITLNGGLFEGAGGFLLLKPLLNNQSEMKLFHKNIASIIKLFSINNDDYISFPGQLSFRVSYDFFSGSSGILTALISMRKNNPLLWIPTINNKNFFSLKGGE
ncbi:class III lanthionine synthetase LanKC [Staphylococcus felis]|uniref:class III lanthionine synthetase LanKC n=1 Tax=Staphylococcus felis TaxID=46127 RepID=UPI0024808257|nr:class III lanthionine synthetase LanKC [Staphylococcus felis]